MRGAPGQPRPKRTEPTGWLAKRLRIIQTELGLTNRAYARRIGVKERSLTTWMSSDNGPNKHEDIVAVTRFIMSHYLPGEEREVYWGRDRAP